MIIGHMFQEYYYIIPVFSPYFIYIEVAIFPDTWH